MTKREFLEGVVGVNLETVTAEQFGVFADFAQAELEKMDAANAKRREKSGEKSGERATLVAEFAATYLVGVAEAEAVTASAVREAMVADGFQRADGKAVNVQYASALCRDAVKMGFAAVKDAKVPKKGLVKVYFDPEAVEEVEVEEAEADE